jgi:polygalacturonase
MDFLVRNFGAVGDGRTKDTDAIQRAIQACHENGGGRVVLSRGTYLTGTLFLRSFVEIHLEVNAVMLGSAEIGDYAPDTFKQLYAGEAHMDRCLIFANGVSDIAFTGRGEINGQGGCFKPQNADGSLAPRPMLFRYLESQNIRILGIKMRDPAAWTNAFIRCQNIWVEGVDIRSRANWNGDGLDFDGCQNVFVSNCLLDCSDDCICLQSSTPELSCRNVVIQNCLMKSKWAGLRIGLLNRGDIEQVAVSNCCFEDIECSALKIQSTEGGAIRDMVFNNLVMQNVQRPLFITLNHFRMGVDSPAEIPETSRVQNLQFTNIRAVGRPSSPFFLRSCLILDGLPGHCLENITLSDVHYSAVGGGSSEDAQRIEIPDLLDKRPECFQYEGALPAYGLFARHVKGLRLNRVQIDCLNPDARPMLYAQDCEVLQGINHES